MISKENAERFSKTGIYFNPNYANENGGWCRNGFWIPHYYPEENELWMFDSYFNSWDSGRHEVTDRNWEEWKLVIDRTTHRQISVYERDEYLENQIVEAKTDSSADTKYFVLNDAKKDIDLRIEKANQELNHAKWGVEYRERCLERLKSEKKELENQEAAE